MALSHLRPVAPVVSAVRMGVRLLTSERVRKPAQLTAGSSQPTNQRRVAPMKKPNKKRKFPPNPLPCGCGAKGIVNDDCVSETIGYTHIHVVHCPMHSAAPGMLAALCDALLEDNPAFGKLDPKGTFSGLAAEYIAARRLLTVTL